MNDSQKLQHLAGQVNGLLPIIFSLVKTHPDATSLSREFAFMTDGQKAMSLPTPAEEEFLLGQSQMHDSIAVAIAAALKKAS